MDEMRTTITIAQKLMSCARSGEKGSILLLFKLIVRLGGHIGKVESHLCHSDQSCDSISKAQQKERSIVRVTYRSESFYAHVSWFAHRALVLRHDSRVPISKHSEVIPLDIQECQYGILPPIFENELDPSLEAISIDCIRAVDERKTYIVPQRLKSRNGEVPGRKEGRECICACEAEGEDLSVSPGAQHLILLLWTEWGISDMPYPSRSTR